MDVDHREREIQVQLDKMSEMKTPELQEKIKHLEEFVKIAEPGDTAPLRLWTFATKTLNARNYGRREAVRFFDIDRTQHINQQPIAGLIEIIADFEAKQKMGQSISVRAVRNWDYAKALLSARQLQESRNQLSTPSLQKIREESAKAIKEMRDKIDGRREHGGKP